MGRYHQSLKGDVGALLYRIIYLGLLYLGVKAFGLSIFDDIILAILGVVTFEIVGFVLRKIGFWKY